MHNQPVAGAAGTEATSSAHMSREATISLVMRVLGERDTILDDGVREQAASIEAANQKIVDANRLSQLTNLGANNAGLTVGEMDDFSDADYPDFTSSKLANGDDFIDFGDGTGVVVERSGDNRSWKMVEYDPSEQRGEGADPTFTNSTRVWGDPHVDEGADGSTDFDFNEQSTFVTPTGVKITVETAPYGNGGATVTDNLYISRGDDQAVVTGLSDNANGGGQSDDTLDVASDGSLFDDATKNDGTIFVTTNGDMSDWAALNGDDISSGKVAQSEVTEEITTLPLTDKNREMLTKAGLDPADYTEGGALVLTSTEMASVTTAMESLFTIEATPENIALLKDMGADISTLQYGNALVFTPAEKENLSQMSSDYVDSLTSRSQTELIALQSLMNKYDENVKQQTNMLSTAHSENDSVIGNTRI
ncbi:DUF1521 domain-containing protein [Thalassomonas haliotis]|uniref:DUF1521 domain-containing protein n=1 Tax=Thalassomonas haliotis TaxID=485448 RepID=A0ABY7V822_9GAMM|nr:DUF1521 domain-containing protein [Thalassomonas haliotis]WDE09415.1 DUF1521 domain-containing protein [Thalassomonas haliotis]